MGVGRRRRRGRRSELGLSIWKSFDGWFGCYIALVLMALRLSGDLS